MKIQKCYTSKDTIKKMKNLLKRLGENIYKTYLIWDLHPEFMKNSYNSIYEMTNNPIKK